MMRVDTVYLNGKVWPGQQRSGDQHVDHLTALAVADGRVVFCGTDDEVRDVVGVDTVTIDLDGRRVVPGLIDGHIHATRAGTTWSRELHWEKIFDVESALATIRDAAAATAANEWICVIGGWHPSQFVDQRLPTRDELDRAGGKHPVYVQALYEVAVLNSEGLRTSGVGQLSDEGSHVVIERGHDGVATGTIRGMGAFAACLKAMGSPSIQEQRAGTAAMIRELHSHGVTGLVDPGGFAMPPERYRALFDLWRSGDLTMRMRLFVSAVDAGQEYQQLSDWLRHVQVRFGDDLLRLNGIGEVVHYGCHDFEGLESSFEIAAPDKDELLRISRATAERGWPMHIHAVLDRSVSDILDCWEVVDEATPLRDLRFTIVHADTISPGNIERLRALGVGVVVDDHLVFKAAMSEAAWGAGTLFRAPPLGDLVRAGVPIAAGTDGNRASSHNPWRALSWLVAGQSVDGITRRGPEHLLTRPQALEAYTAGSARLTFEEADRGHLGEGARADFAVLNADFFSVATEEIPDIGSDLTVVGGRTVFSTGAVTE
jgi:predicted amidohydrolase YtcJ